MKKLALFALALVLTGCPSKPTDGGSYEGKSVEQWMNDLQAGNAEARKNACFALGELGPKAAAAAPNLAAMLKDKDVQMRTWATVALMKIGEPAVPALAKEMEQGDSTIRKHALEALVNIGANAGAAVPALITSLKDEDPDVRKDAAAVLALVGPAAKSAVPALTAALKDENADVRNVAGQALKAIDPDAAKRAGVE